MNMNINISLGMHYVTKLLIEANRTSSFIVYLYVWCLE